MKFTKTRTFIITISILFSLISCTNIFSSDSDSGANNQNNNSRTITLKGSVNTESIQGAMPSVLFNTSNNSSEDNGERSASYSGLPSEFQYFAIATKRGGTEIMGDDDGECEWMVSGTEKSFAMNLGYGTWDVVAGIRKAGSSLNPAEADIIYKSASQEINLPEGSPLIYTAHFNPRPRMTSSGNGTIKLTMTKPANLDFVTCKLLLGDSSAWTDAGFTSDESISGISIAGNTVFLGNVTNGTSIKSGSYTVQLKFYDCAAGEYDESTDGKRAADVIGNGKAVLVYSTIQTINIFDNLVTNYWTRTVYDDTYSPVAATGGTFVLDDDKVNHFNKTHIYVSSAAKGGSNSNSGTYYQPYLTLSQAIRYIDLEGSSSENYSITIDGTISDNATISSTTASKANKITIEGKSGNTSDILSGGDASPVLTVSGNVPVVIQNLQITSSYSVAQGGGINMSAGSDVTLESGALVTDCKAIQNGGGVYNAGGTLRIKGGKITNNHIIDNNNSYGGVGVFLTNNASCIMESGEISGNDERSHSDVRGGALRMEGKSTFQMSGGKLSANKTGNYGAHIYAVSDNASDECKIEISGSAEISDGVISGVSDVVGGSDAYGTVAWLEGAGVKMTMSGGKITGNIAKAKNGTQACAGVYLYNSSKFTMTGGLISGNEVQNGTARGGAVGINSAGTPPVFTMSGSAYIPYGGSAGKNDVHLETARSITVDGALNPTDNGKSDGTAITTSAATITLSSNEWVRGRTVLEKGTNLSELTDAIAGKFDFSEKGWDKKTTSAAVKVDADIYVAGTDSVKCAGFTPVDDGNTIGNWAHPFASIARAISAGVLDANHTTIIVDGTVNGTQTISSLPASVTSLALKGYKASNSASSSGVLKRYATMPESISDDGSALTVDASSKTVTISDLSITGGCATNGGGINITAGTVTLGGDTKIYGNKATNGGGVYLAGSGTTLNMQGSAVIGDTSAHTAGNSTLNQNPSSDEGCANWATSGGGIYSNGGNVYVGCDSTGSTSTFTLSSAGGVRRNFATYGGGVFISGGTFMTGSGQISYNYAYKGGGIYTSITTGHKILGSVNINNNKAGDEGGGLYIASGSTVSMSGSAKITKNNAVSGGGVAIYGTFNMSSGTIGGDSSESGNTSSSGGGVDISVENSSPYPAGTFNMTGGTISYNSCGNNGGGIAIGSRTKSGTTYNGTANISGGIISNNKASSNGGAILQDGFLNIRDDISIPYGVTTNGTKTESPGNNDVYLFRDGRTITVKSATLGGGTSVATVTPASWKRGTNIIDFGVSVETDQKTTIKSQIQLSKDNDGWERDEKISNSKTYIYITSPIYVADASNPLSGFGAGKTKSAGATGTKSNPYNSIAEALKDSDLASVKKIKIAGTVKGAQTISGTLSTDTLTIEGYTVGGVTSALDGGFSATKEGTTLTVSSEATVTIQNLTIKGGYADGSGGGINVKTKAAVNLADGAVVKGNYASSKGGGVKVESGAYFAAYGTSVIGNSSATEASSTATLDSGANQAQKGGGIYSDGVLCFGKAIDKSGTESGTPSWSGGLMGNVATGVSTGSAGGAIYVADGKANIYAGNINCNYSAGSGGAIFVNRDSDFVTMSDGRIFKNTASENGGAVDVRGTFNMTGGTIGKDASGNIAANEATSTNSGAIYVAYNATKFSMGGGAQIPYVSAKKNDVYLAQNGTTKSKLTVSSALTTSNAVTLDFPNAEKGMLVVDGTATNVALASDWDSFSVSSSTGKLALKNVITTLYVYPSHTNAYAPSSNYDKASTWKHYNSVENNSNYSLTHPFKTLDAALQFLTWQSEKQDYRINITGTLTGAQVLPASDTTKKITLSSASSGGTASKITLVGANTSAMLDGGMSNTSDVKKSTLTISTTVPVTIQTLKITRGYASGSTDAEKQGGGINITAASTVTLGENVGIYSNNASKGGGIYVASGATLNVTTDTTKIYSNSSSDGGGIYNAGTLDMTAGKIYSNSVGTETSYSGGGVYSTGTFYMSGTANIYSNTASIGGGVFNSGTFTMGASVASATAGLTGAIYKNQAIPEDCTDGGGGVCNTGTFTIKAGTIGGSATNKNTVTWNGGGVYNKGTFTMYGGTISYNEATEEFSEGSSTSPGGCGGGVYSFDTNNSFTLDGGTIDHNTAGGDGGGIYVTQKPFTFKSGTISNNSGRNGGGVFCNNAMTMSGGSISGNSSTTTGTSVRDFGGGGVYCYDSMVMSAGTISGNKAAKNGGGVFMEGMLYMSETAVIGDSGASGYATSETACSNYAAGDGGGVYLVYDSGIVLGANAYPWSSNKKELTGGIYYNYASGSGGGIYNDANDGMYLYTGNVCKNGAGVNGGGVCSHMKEFEMSGGTIDGNYAVNGGGIYFVGNTIDSTYFYPTLSGGTISNNMAEIKTGTSGGKGGGIYIGEKNNLRMTGGTISGNTAKDSTNSNLASGGGVYITYGSLFMSKKALIGDTGTSTSTYSNKAISATAGGGIFSSDGNVYIGYKSETETEAFDSGTYGVCHNEVTGSSAFGGGIYVLRGVLKIAGGYIQYNSGKYGGAVYLNNITTCDISGGTFQDNKATNSGGALYVKKTSLDIASASFLSNSATDGSSNGSGGAIYIDSSNNPTVTIKTGTTFNSNSAVKSGGAIYNASTGLTLDGGDFGKNNRYNEVTASDGKGGAIYTSKKIVLGGATIWISTSAKTNDVFLFSNGSIEPKSSIGNTAGNRCLITRSWNVGDKVLEGSYISTHLAKFTLSNSSYKIGTSGLLEAN